MFFHSRKSGNKVILFFYIGLDEGATGVIEPIYHDTKNMVTGFAGKKCIQFFDSFIQTPFAKN